MCLGMPGSTGIERSISKQVRLEYTVRETINWTLASATGGSGLATVQVLQQVLDG
jgi:hypothetical protein